jgi:hypothetical protein
MKKNLKLWSVYSIFVFLLASCSSTAHIEKDDNADFSRYRTFAWIDKDGEGKHDQNKNNDLTELKIREAVNKELEKTAGWKEVKNRPDVLNKSKHQSRLFETLFKVSVQSLHPPVYDNLLSFTV